MTSIVSCYDTPDLGRCSYVGKCAVTRFTDLCSTSSEEFCMPTEGTCASNPEGCYAYNGTYFKYSGCIPANFTPVSASYCADLDCDGISRDFFFFGFRKFVFSLAKLLKLTHFAPQEITIIANMITDVNLFNLCSRAHIRFLPNPIMETCLVTVAEKMSPAPRNMIVSPDIFLMLDALRYHRLLRFRLRALRAPLEF